MKPQKPETPTGPVKGPGDPAAPEPTDAEAAAKAMTSDHQAFTGAATGVGSVAFDDDGAFDVGAETARPAGPPPKR